MRAQAFIRRPRKIPWITLLLSTAAVALYLLPWAAAVFIFDGPPWIRASYGGC